MEIELNDGYKAQIDPEDYDFIMSLNPSVVKSYRDRYAYLFGKLSGSMFSISRCLVNPPEGLVVTFLDGDRLNLQKSNLSICRWADIPRAKYRNMKLQQSPPSDIEVFESKPKAPPKPRGRKRYKDTQSAIARREQYKKYTDKNKPRKNIYTNKAIKEEERRKHLVEDLVQDKALEVKTFDSLADVFKDFVPDGWEPPKRDT